MRRFEPPGCFPLAFSIGGFGRYDSKGMEVRTRFSAEDGAVEVMES